MIGILNMESVFVDGARCWFCIACCQWVCFTSRLIYVGKDRAVLKSVLGKETHNMFKWFWAHSIFALQGVCVWERAEDQWCGITGLSINTFLVLRYTDNNKYSQKNSARQLFLCRSIGLLLFTKNKRKSSDGPQHSWWEQWMGLSRLTRILLMMNNEDFNNVFVVSMIDIFTFARISTLPFWAFFPATPQKSKTHPWSA